jgi:glutaredoxin-like protein
MLQNQEGKRIPEVVFKTRNGTDWEDVSTDQLFKGKKVIVFSLPGAFTPTCSSTHLPRYNELAPVFRKQGIDDIVCLSVNDAFVMNEWKKDQSAENVKIIPDGNGEFTEAMGMLVDKRSLGFGKRSWRYSMLVNDGMIEKMFIEPEVDGDPFEVSDADTMLDYINPQADRPADISLFTKAGCPHCARAKALLKDKGLAYEEIPLSREVTLSTLRAVTGADTVPQVFINGVHVGTADELGEYLK